MKLNKRWIYGIVAAGLIVGGGYLFVSNVPISAQQLRTGGERAASEIALETGAVTIRSADSVVGAVSAAGYIELVAEQSVASDVSGVLDEIAVSTGDLVEAGDMLATLDAVDLERAAQRAELSVETARNALDELLEEADAADIAVAKADLKEAEENLADVLDGPSDDEIAAAESNLASAWAKYNEIQAGFSDAEETQLIADLKKKEVALAEARRAYEEIAWRNDVGMTPEAAAFQQATIDYESALAAYEEASAPADASDRQSALSAAQNAQVQLDDLLNSPTDAEIAVAEARVADATAKLDDLVVGADASTVREAEIALERALLDLEEAYANLAASRITAPIDGTVLSIHAEVGERLTEGAILTTLADTTQLELTIDVAEVDVVQVHEGQTAQVEIDALSGQLFEGVVAYIAPASSASAGVVNYPVTIRLVDETLATVRPGMTAVATLEQSTDSAENLWLVPTSALLREEDSAAVNVIRGETAELVSVVPGTVQGEWTVVESDHLNPGDQVMGTLSSYVEASEAPDGFGPREGGVPPSPFGR